MTTLDDETPAVRIDVGAPETATPQMRIITLCTGNAARSVIAGALLAEAVPAAAVRTAGTHVIEHQPMSIRTRRAFEHLGVQLPAHRSHQLTHADVATADLIVAMAAEHVQYIRRRHPEAADRTATAWWLARNLPPGPAPLTDRLAALVLASVEPQIQGDIDDPAGGEVDVYIACAVELSAAVAALAPLL